ncbi:hypothetical protein Y1Q_0014074 [Alligator mississippiensis]|uniref:G-protein coupled receptors family 1 profile domain-containing protein n=1 Tax=Alligator mississippiensis TaxID=8496 RepID=A0A151MJT2_ALLMI|nr:hypothetical protein Y1Q_0014074 [Alligator mississippiensis]
MDQHMESQPWEQLKAIQAPPSMQKQGMKTQINVQCLKIITGLLFIFSWEVIHIQLPKAKWSSCGETKLCCLVLACWTGGFIHSTVQTILTMQLPYCGPNHVDNFFCDVPPVIKLACTDTYVMELLTVSNSGLISTSCFIILVTSYTTILVKIRSPEGRRKALSTCASHLTVVTLIFGPCIFIYARPFSIFSVDKQVSVVYNIITPMLSPLVYTLRNKEVKSAMKRLKTRSITSGEKIIS